MNGDGSQTSTFLFTDIESSTVQWETVDDMHDRVEAHFEALRAAVSMAGGEVFATMGDGIAAAFDSAHSAVSAAVRAQLQMPDIGLRSRMGIHTGEARRVGGDYRGRPVNRAARVMAAGHGGQILLSDLSATLVRTGADPTDLRDLGIHRLRDLTEPEHLWQVLHPDLASEFAPVRGVDTYSHNLPTQRSSMIGRDDDMSHVVELVRDHRIVTLTGFGGVGKTRLAVQSAAELLADFDDVRFTELAPVDDDDVAAAIARSFGVASAPDPLDACRAVLAGHDTLLVVDNCEHVIDRAADVVAAISDTCPRVTVIATSREALGIDGEHVVPVTALDPDTAATELFLARATAAGYAPHPDDAEHVRDICHQLDGIPLAIELAAARTPVLGVRGVVHALGDRFHLLTRRRRGDFDRHATMRSAIDWSYRMLDTVDQRLFRMLSAFPSGVELDAMPIIAGELEIAEADAIQRIASLADRNMVVADAADSGVRFHMLETIRHFALEQLAADGERAVALGLVAEWICTITDLPFDDACSAAVERNAIRLEREADNWREAMGLARRLESSALGARLCGAPVAFFLLGRHDLSELVRPVAEMCTGEPEHRRSALCALMVSAAGATSPAQLHEWADEMDRLDRESHTGLRYLMRWLAHVWSGDFEWAIATCLEGSFDARVAQGTRDLLVGIAVLDRFSLTDARDDPGHLIERALEVADRSEVALQRVSCRLGAAWGLAHRNPERALVLARQALDDIDDVPSLTRLTLPGSAARLLAQLDPRVAAQGLLSQLDASPARRSFVDLIPLSYATSLLARVGHPDAGPSLATMTVSPVAPYLSMMDFVDLARRAVATSNPVSLIELEQVVRRALREIADGTFEPIPEPVPVEIMN